ncbi:hypothetical protein VB780_15045 [Leptolyngbya sp. CCNP1308]|uniref:hypothetical protein n=1 Tax=Leptolyngbya sp. CCNP1308 TaxID=3110255 RepID=UPI002B216DEF|nr:hypothetical protein [Leptolyngbya sp. CCNP1308]MEA5449894.1 hypothetical protein [Leptolyngbya sp. CCNP1308]
MKRGIRITKVRLDNDTVELRISVSGGESLFSNRVYVGYSQLADIVAQLDVFKDHIYGGLLDIQFGEFGPEYAMGAFHARFHFAKPGELYISCKQQSEFKDFSVTKVASEAKFYLKTEPALLDNFLNDLKSLYEKRSEEAYLETI